MMPWTTLKHQIIFYKRDKENDRVSPIHEKNGGGLLLFRGRVWEPCTNGLGVGASTLVKTDTWKKELRV